MVADTTEVAISHGAVERHMQTCYSELFTQDAVESLPTDFQERSLGHLA